MTSRTLRTERDVESFCDLLRNRKRPLTVTVVSGRKRSTPQNSTAHMWFKEIADQLGDRTEEDVRAECKLTLGVPILRGDSDDFRAKYDAVVRPLDYERKLALMVEPFDFPVTRLMNVTQMVRFLDAIQRQFIPMGVRLTDPDPLGRAA